jgi:hypothetical protein
MWWNPLGTVTVCVLAHLFGRERAQERASWWPEVRRYATSHLALIIYFGFFMIAALWWQSRID